MPRSLALVFLTATLSAADTSPRRPTYDTSKFQLLRTLEGHIDWVWGAAFDRTGRHLLSGSGINKIPRVEKISGALPIKTYITGSAPEIFSTKKNSYTPFWAVMLGPWGLSPVGGNS